MSKFVDQNSSTNGARYTQPIGVIAADGTWSGKLTFTDTPESTDETAFTGLLKIGNSSIYYSWGVTAKSGVVIKKPEVLTPPAGAGIGGDVTYTPETSAIAAGGVEAENLTLTKLVWNTPSAGSWNIYGIKVNGQFLTDESLFTHLNISDPQHIWDGDESLTAILGPTSTLEVDISGFNPITKLEMKDYGDGADDGYWQLFQDNGKSEWLAYNESDEVVLDLSTSPSGYVWHERFSTLTKLTFTNDKAYDSADGTEMTTIDQAFKAGNKVVGKGTQDQGFASYVATETDCFTTTLYTGNAAAKFDGSEQVITTGIDNTQKSMIWFKNRDDSTHHVLFDTERTPPDYRWLYSNETDAEKDTAAILKDRTDTGFTVVQAVSGSGTNRTNPHSNEKMVAWNFRAAPGFMDVVTYEGNQT